MNKLRLPFIVFICILLASCKAKLSDNTTNDWNSGKMVLSTDENLETIMDQLVEIYEHENDSAQLALNYLPQEKIVSDFVNGKIKSMVISRKLTTGEKQVATQNQAIEIQESIFGYNAVAIIAGNNFSDSVIRLSSLKDFLQPGSPVKLIFDNKQSGIPNLIMQKAHLSPELFKNALVASNAKEILEYIHRDEHAIGFISFNTVSDLSDPKTQELLKTIKVLDVEENNIISSISQQSIFDFTYPLSHPLNIVLGNNPELIGRGFTNFLCRERAAKIMLKAGIVARIIPVRNINVHNDLQTKP